jgi:hypothetical protein
MDNKGIICWNCVHPLPGQAIHLPIKYNDKKNVFETIGEFCSWSCAKRYAMDIGTHRTGEICSLLAMMKLRTIGHYEPTWPSPNKIVLKCFGGTMDIEEFRNRKEPPNVHWPAEKRCYPIIGGYTDSNITNKISGKCNAPVSGKLADIASSTTSTNTLKLKRPKPLARAESSLENVLGIKRREK